MTSSNSSSPKKSKNLDENQDLISNMPTIVTDKVLKLLPLQMTAKMSVLSKTWRQNWLSHRYLIFDQAFWKEIIDKNEIPDLRKALSIVTDVLTHHVGPIHEFYAFIPCPRENQQLEESLLTFRQWFSLLSKSEVNKIVFINMIDPITMPSELFKCKELRKLGLYHCVLDHPPCDFEGFAFLSILKLVNLPELKEDVFESFVASCPRLLILTLDHWIGVKHVVINSPKLEYLHIRGEFESIIFKNIISLKSASFYLYGTNSDFSIEKANNAIKILASSSKIHDLRLGGKMCKFFGASTILGLGNLAFQYLQVLRLSGVDLNDFYEFQFTVSMLQSCPFLLNFVLWITPDKSTKVPHNIKCDENLKLERLLKMEITGIRGSEAELDLIKNVLGFAVMLKSLTFRCQCDIGANSEKKVIETITSFPRASPKAKLVVWERIHK